MCWHSHQREIPAEVAFPRGEAHNASRLVSVLPLPWRRRSLRTPHLQVQHWVGPEGLMCRVFERIGVQIHRCRCRRIRRRRQQRDGQRPLRLMIDATSTMSDAIAEPA